MLLILTKRDPAAHGRKNTLQSRFRHSSTDMAAEQSRHMIRTSFVARTLIPQTGQTYFRVLELLNVCPLKIGRR